MEFADEGGEGPTPYEVLLRDALRGDSTHFMRQDGVEETWRIVQPLLDNPPPVKPYAPGSWGPDEAETLLRDYGPWRGAGRPGWSGPGSRGARVPWRGPGRPGGRGLARTRTPTRSAGP